MKNIWIIMLITIILLAVGCTQNEDNSDINSKSSESMVVTNGINLITEQEKVNEENEESILTEEEALKIAKEAHYRYNIVWNFGKGLPNSVFEHQGERIKINGYEYVYFSSSLDTIEKFNEYMGEVVTDKSIEAIIAELGIITYEGKLLALPYDAGNSKNWFEAKIISVDQTGEIANVVIEIPLLFFEDKPESILKELTFIFDSNKGWLIDTETPFEDLY